MMCDGSGRAAMPNPDGYAMAQWRRCAGCRNCLKPGSALRDDESAEELARAKAEAERRSAATAAQEAENLCTRCMCVAVCAIAAAVRVVGGEGHVTISRCGGHIDMGPGPEPEPAGERG